MPMHDPSVRTEASPFARVVALAVALTGSCSDRRGASTDEGPAIVVLTDAPLVARAGAVAVVPVPGSSFAPGTTYRGNWSIAGGSLTEGVVRAATPSLLAVFVPLWADGWRRSCLGDADVGCRVGA